MNPHPMKIILLCIPVGFAVVHAGPRTSSDYKVTAESVDAGGARAASSSYTNDGGIGGVVGLSTVASPAQTARAGYIGQLYEVAALAVAASPTSVNEAQTTQLAATQVMDDDTTLPVPAEDVAWSVLSGPIAEIGSGGLVTTESVYQDTPAQAQGSHAGLLGVVNLTVLETLPDNFGSYAGDGLGDDWQIQYFGQDNPLAAPLLDPDGDGQNNSFEFTAGLVPTDPLSRFSLTIAPVPGEPGQKELVFDPIVGGRSYTVMTSTSMAPGSWSPLVGGIEVDDGDQRSVTDPSAGETSKFYRVEITKP